MAERRKWADGPGEDAGRTAPLPDLTDVDLPTLRALDDPGLMAAVDRVLEGTPDSKEIWYVGSEGGRRTFPADLAGGVRGEDSRG
ncbi:hypothetical protein [Streptomyces sp. HUAS ZL42]|uniref:hypothetical protein n=1 Tax=Streptomyces sp. HUAS ZL42 TaxID=3231715 RepID=UPI00345E5AF0